MTMRGTGNAGKRLDYLGTGNAGKLPDTSPTFFFLYSISLLFSRRTTSGVFTSVESPYPSVYTFKNASLLV